ncbi:uncharacterized protein LOC106056714 [Biomphalaria glabrata]|uniref:Uncharacterized protein LOC106056714 n=1 Tax=Biomphalaria glabrata TaxID=6526 RepID=A0A2C9LFB7_BIOGL|nr:uncharacterized protein LOC106056714 [Biomphalaria glabrata]XP_013068992.1 uncharacterized protein LOC106056714 [Biomphalaria glabrata]XP_055860478.1 uncharacterized protein LOC106056714 [Biomphalaria glabrata]XP_055860479.1 uncharacterized protein LOC106056714 [Biomphalaria glabrata]KAI8767520.1 hypothetical protein BgiBS90_028826 [Biomphalaria glabrata]
MACIKQLIKFVKLLLIAVRFTLSSTDLPCDAYCFKGSFCKGQDCIPCPYGTFISQDGHTFTVCKRWTTMSGPNIIQITPGSESRDIVWGCETGYIKHDINAAEWDCIKAPTTTTTTTITTSTSTSISTTIKPTMATVPVGSSQELETPYIAAIAIGCSVIIIAAIIIYLYIRYCRRRPNNTDRSGEVRYHRPPNATVPDKDLLDLFSEIERVLSKDDIIRLIDYLHDPNGKIIKQKESQKALISWANGYPEFDHPSLIRDTLSRIGIELPLNSSEINSLTLADGLFKADRLNNAFKNFCGEMCTWLGMDAEKLAILLNLKNQLDIQKSSKNFELAFTVCMGKWAFGHPFRYTENDREWEPLTIVRRKLIEMERNDIVEDLPTLTSCVYTAMENYNSQSYQNGATNIV